MRLALAQINTTVGDFTGNEARIRMAYQRGAELGVDAVIAPELSICGYPPRDLILRESFLRSGQEVLERLAQATGSTALVVGFPGEQPRRPGRPVTNAAALLRDGRVQAVRAKTLLPTYDVFDEDRYFEPATANEPVPFGQSSVGLTICEDVWNDQDFWKDRRYTQDPAANLIQSGVGCLWNISASPWHLGKNQLRLSMLASMAAKWRCPLVYCNLVGGNDELVFDGGSLVIDAQGRLLAQGKRFEEDFVVVDLEASAPIAPLEIADEELLYKALVLGLRDYLHKCGFTSAVLGLSGGIDSAVTAVIAAEALGPDNVHGVSLPSRFSSRGSLDDARCLAAHLGIRYDVIPIEPIFEVTCRQLKTVFAGRPEDTTEENIQARLRAVVLMGLSNKFGALLLTTGNKSELAVGYCTLYGDMCGGLAVISDVPKTLIYRLARWINREREVIPQASITKPPSAELRPNQTDQDTLPPYDVLDAILQLYVVEGRSTEEIIAQGHSKAVVRHIVRLIDQNEYKRRQAAPGLKVTSKAFGVGRRIPIAQGFHRHRP